MCGFIPQSFCGMGTQPSSVSPLGSPAWRGRGSSPGAAFRPFNSITDSASCDRAGRFHLESGFGNPRGRSTAQANKLCLSSFLRQSQSLPSSLSPSFLPASPLYGATPVNTKTLGSALGSGPPVIHRLYLVESKDFVALKRCIWTMT
jgi:hypothetical protein